MKVQDWIFTVRYFRQSDLRRAVIGPARPSTVEAALHLAEVPEAVRAQIRSCAIVRDFVDGRLDPDKSGYYHHVADSALSWCVCIGSVHDVLGDR